MIRDGDETVGCKPRVPKCFSPHEKIHKLQISKSIQMKIGQIKEGKNQAVTNLPLLE